MKTIVCLIADYDKVIFVNFMAIYSISDLETLTGVKAHTLRTWEKRYNVLCPNRSESNVRYYEEEDLRKILNIVILYNHGHKISKIAMMDREEIQNLVAQISEVDQEFENDLDALTLSLLSLDQYNFNKILNKKIENLGLIGAMLEVVYPLLDKMGMMWMAGSMTSVHEKFVIQIIRRKLITAIDGKSNKKLSKPKFVLFLPPEEDNELSLLFMQYIILESGFQVLNLGANLSCEDLLEAFPLLNPEYIMTVINEKETVSTVQVLCEQISQRYDKVRMLLTGIQANAVSDIDANIKIIQGIDDLSHLLDSLTSLV